MQQLTLAEIKASAYQRKELDVQVPLSEEELSTLRQELVRIEIERDKLDEEKKAVLSGFNDQYKDINKQRANLLKSLRLKFVEERCNTYVVANYADDMVEYYNERGVLVESIKMKAMDRQMNIIPSIASNA